jgi:4-diphosphocytidyl-2-C-methyl-D-erythritol kinase
MHISTAWAFSQIKPQLPTRTTDNIVKLPVPQWKNQLVNDFEAAVLLAHPELAQLKNNLYQQGATYVSMSGSGSSFFALFPLTINVKALTLGTTFRIDFI